jgi:hypothetical protein
MRGHWLIAVALLQGCYVGPVFKLKPRELTCAEPFHPWGGGLVTHVAQGRGDGRFDYDPPGGVLDRISGEMNLRTGEFFWVEDYADDSYRADNTVEGYGTIWRDGDLDVRYDMLATTDEGDEFDYTVREQRLGCDMERWIEENIDDVPDPTEVWDGTFTDDGFEYEHRFGRYGEVMVAEGRTESDGSYEESLRFEEGGDLIHWDEEGDGEGVVRREFDERLDFQLTGSWERQKNGDLEVAFEFKAQSGPLQTWSYDVSERGNGTGRLQIGGSECDLSFDEWSCRLEDCNVASLEGEPCDAPMEPPRLDIR